MATHLFKNAEVLVTMDETRREIRGGGFLATDGVITHVGPSDSLPKEADDVTDLSGLVVIPGLVNTHHHLIQNLTRVVPAGQDAPLFGWLTSLYPIWSRCGPEHVKSAVTIGLAEMALSGCTTSSDHLYLYPNGARLDDEIEAALAIGVRFHATRGAMSIGVSKGGLPPDSLTENEDFVLKDSIRLIETHHDPKPYALMRVALAPCSPFTVSKELMRDAAILARQYGVGLHTHLAENVEDIDYSLEKFGMRPGDYVKELGWTGNDVWHAHCVQLNCEEIDLFAATGTGIAHCPCSNMRLASGIAPVRKWRDRGVKVGLGVDGSASNDSGHLLAEARQAMLLQRVQSGAKAMGAREALEIATRGGASVLNRDDIGAIEVGKAADFAAYRLDTIDMTGASWDPVAALVFMGPHKAWHTYVQGRAVVKEGLIATLDLNKAMEQHKKLVIGLING